MECAFHVNVHMMNYILFPILDSTGWYLKCDTLVCPVAEEIELSTAEGIELLRWEGDTVMCSKWQVSYGPEEPIGVAEAEAVDVVLEPNPARGRVGVKLTVGMTGLSVYNVQGALVERQEARGIQAEIDVTGWPKGVYYVTVSTPTGVAQRRLVVQ